MNATPYRISTITATGNMNSVIDLYILYPKLQVIDMENDTCGVIYAEFGNNKHDRICKGVNLKKSQKTRKNVKKKECLKRFDNSITILLRISKGCEVNVKLFKNGKVQMTGLKTESVGNFVLEYISKMIKNIHEKVIQETLDEEPESVSESVSVSESNVIIKDIDSLRPTDLSIHLINSDFKVNIEIRRDLLYKLLINEYSVICTYEPCIYPGVKIQYFLNKDRSQSQSQFTAGKCMCLNAVCNGKGDGITTDNCKKITISVFQSGCILITGVTRKEHIDIGYDFIVSILKKHEKQVKRVKLLLT